MKNVVDTDFVVEVNNEKGFVRSLKSFKTIEAAEDYVATTDVELKENEYLNIIFIDYNENGDEICFGSVV